MPGKIILFFVFLSCAASAQEWKLVWSDDFAGDTVDESKWEFMIGDGTQYGLPKGWGNNERQYYRKENATVKDGRLYITAKKEKFSGADYTSARLRTKEKADWRYGKFEIRAKMPIGKGIWPALWMLPTYNVYGTWAASGEIDIVEYLGHEANLVHGTLHFGGQWPNNQYKGKSYTLNSGTFHDDFHVFAMEWEEGEFRWYVDGALYQTLGTGDWWSSGGDFPAPFNEYFHLLFNLAVGGNWPGYPDSSTEFPQELVIDYVRVFQRESTDIDNKSDKRPLKYGLEQNYPNPFNPATSISYRLAHNSDVEISVYNVHGERIKTLVQNFKHKGHYSVLWDGRDFDGRHSPSGIYFCHLFAGSQSDIIKMTLIH